MKAIAVMGFPPTLPNFAAAKWAQLALCKFGLHGKRVDVKVLI